MRQEANDSCVEEELGLTGASAEDTEAEFIRKICETELLAGEGHLAFYLLGKFMKSEVSYGLSYGYMNTLFINLLMPVMILLVSLFSFGVQKGTCSVCFCLCW